MHIFYQNAIKLLVLTVAVMASNANAEPLKPVVINYTLSMVSDTFGNSTLGRVENRLSQSDSGYSVLTITKAQGMAAIIMGSNEQQSCEFAINGDRTISTDYDGGRIGKAADYHVTFDWEDRTLKFDSGESLDMPEGYVVNNCSIPFAAAIMQGKGLGDEPIYVVDGKSKRIRGYKLQSSTEEVVNTNIGEKKTIKMVLQRELRPERTFTFWLSTEDQFMPVKIEEKRKSRTTTLSVDSLEILESLSPRAWLTPNEVINT